MTDPTSRTPVEPPLGQALIPVVLLIALLGAAVYLFGDESSFGPNQIALVLGTAVAGLVGLANGQSWAEIEGAIRRGIATSMGAILILLVVGSVIGTWILAGIVPTMIHYGLSLLAPSIFYAAACAICAVVALATGSSWTTAGTVGLALIGTAAAYDLHPGIAAGAIISGAYFGDKMSPLSDTTNLAPAVAGSELFTHIRHMVWTTAPSFGLALILFAAIGLATPAPEGAGDLDAVLAALERSFALGPHLLIPLVLVLTLVVRRMPAFPALLIGALVGGLFAVLFQPEAVLRYVDEPDLARPVALVKGVWQALHGGYVLDSGNAALDELLSRGGMASMLQTVWLIMTAMMYGHRHPAGAGPPHPVRGAQRRRPDRGHPRHRVRRQRPGLGPVHLHRAPGPDVPRRVPAAAARPEEPVAHPGGLGHHHLGADSLEHLRRVHGPDARRVDADLRAVRLLQPDQPVRRRPLRLRAHRDRAAGFGRARETCRRRGPCHRGRTCGGGVGMPRGLRPSWERRSVF